MRKYRQSGVALIELALTIPMLLMLSLIVADLGRAIYEYNTVAKGTRDAARYLSFQTPNTQPYMDNARNLVRYGATANTGVPLAPGLTAATVTPSWSTLGTIPAINAVTVTVSNYCFRPLFNTAFGLNFGSTACPAGGGSGIVFSNISATLRAPI